MKLLIKFIMSSSVSNTSLPYTVIIMVNKKAYMFLLNMLPSVVGLFFYYNVGLDCLRRY